MQHEIKLGTAILSITCQAILNPDEKFTLGALPDYMFQAARDDDGRFVRFYVRLSGDRPSRHVYSQETLTELLRTQLSDFLHEHEGSRLSLFTQNVVENLAKRIWTMDPHPPLSLQPYRWTSKWGGHATAGANALVGTLYRGLHFYTGHTPALQKDNPGLSGRIELLKQDQGFHVSHQYVHLGELIKGEALRPFELLAAVREEILKGYPFLAEHALIGRMSLPQYDAHVG